MSPLARHLCPGHRSALVVAVLIGAALLVACASTAQRTQQTAQAGSLSVWGDSPFAVMERTVDVDRLVLPPPEVIIDEDGALLHAVATVMTAPGRLPHLERTDGEAAGEVVPLIHTHVRAHMSGPVARVEIVQRYRNPSDAPIDAAYIFPLPENSAVDAMRMTIGARELEAAIMERGAARRTFEEARDEGHTAALLEQQRPNVFSQAVANVAPGADIEVVVSYVQELTWDAGRYEWTFPLVVGERYGVDHRDPDLPPDQRVVPPVLGRGERPGDVSIEVVAEAGVPIHSVSVPTHEVDVTAREASSFALRLQESESMPNRDFVLRYEVGTPETRAALTTHHPGVGEVGYATLTLYPRYVDLDHEVGQRELIFVVDVSGSMQGEPLAQCKEALAAALERLRPVDTFNVVTFASGERRLFEAPVPASTQNVRAALDAVATMRAGGGTQMREGVRAAFEQPPAEGRARNVFLMTDGKINNEAEILDLTRTMVSRFTDAGLTARVFALGVGHTPNHHLTHDLPAAGGGISVQVAPGESGVVAADRFFTVVDHAVLEDVTLDWGELQVEAMHPAVVPDLFASRPVVVHARYRVEDGDEVSETVTVRGELDGEPVEIELEATLTGQPHGSSAERTLWARSAVETLESRLWRGLDRGVEQEILALGLAHQIVTPFTSFVVVDPTPPPAPKPVAEAAPPVVVTEKVAEATPAPVKKTREKRRDEPRADRGSRSSSSSAGSIGGLSDKGTATRGTGRGLGKKSRADKRVEASVSAPKSSDLDGSGLTAAAVHKVFKKKRSAMRKCYERRVITGEVADAVKLIVQLVIGLDGTPRDIVVISSVDDDELEACVARVVKRMQFPEPANSVVKLKFPVQFKAEDND